MLRSAQGCPVLERCSGRPVAALAISENRLADRAMLLAIDAFLVNHDDRSIRHTQMHASPSASDCRRTTINNVLCAAAARYEPGTFNKMTRICKDEERHMSFYNVYRSGPDSEVHWQQDRQTARRVDSRYRARNRWRCRS